MRFTTSALTLVVTLSSAVIAAPLPQTASDSISNRILTRNAQAAQHLNRVFRQLTESTGCSGNQTACIDGALATCTGGKFRLEACPAEQACFAIPRTDSPGTETLCATPADVKDAIQSAGGRDGVFGNKEEAEVPQPQQGEVPGPSQQKMPAPSQQEVPPSQEQGEKSAEREKPANQDSETDTKQEEDRPSKEESSQPNSPAASTTKDCTTTTPSLPSPTAAPQSPSSPELENGPITVTVTITHSSAPVVTLASQVRTTTLDPAAVKSLLAEEGVVVKTKTSESPRATSVDIELPGGKM